MLCLHNSHDDDSHVVNSDIARDENASRDLLPFPN